MVLPYVHTTMMVLTLISSAVRLRGPATTSGRWNRERERLEEEAYERSAKGARPSREQGATR